MRTVKVGPELHAIIRLCRKARLPLLIEGPRGIGKSQLLHEHAREENIGCIVRDLSLMEAVDLAGMPRIEGNRTIFCPPAFLPTDGEGLLVFEELNRAPPHVRTPCLELCTQRRLNDYPLPDGWAIMAAVNPFGGDYEVDELDLALLSRFVRVTAVADRESWLRWGRENQVHKDVLIYVESDPTVFDDPESNPRSWVHVSDLLNANRELRVGEPLLQIAVAGKVGPERAASFFAYLKKRIRPLTAQEILTGYSRYQATLQSWVEQEGRLDLVRGSLLAVQKYLQVSYIYEKVASDPAAWKNLTRFFRDLPGDLREQARHDFKERGYRFPLKMGNTNGQ
jgi:hypothetical protein